MAMEFCQWLSAITGNEYRLPTDYEWEWAVRGRKVNQSYWWGNDVKQGLLWCDETRNAGRTRSRSEAIAAHKNAGVYHPTKRLKAEGYGLMDLHGNVFEWTINSELGESYNSTQTEGSPRFLVGGSWDDDAINARCGDRGDDSPGNRSDDLGFRIVLR
jgi:formylglycine-generating enzyme required for sulfatase activity